MSRIVWTLDDIVNTRHDVSRVDLSEVRPYDIVNACGQPCDTDKNLITDGRRHFIACEHPERPHLDEGLNLYGGDTCRRCRPGLIAAIAQHGGAHNATTGRPDAAIDAVRTLVDRIPEDDIDRPHYERFLASMVIAAAR